MNVLLAEAGVPYDQISTWTRSTPSSRTADVALVIGANDIVNPGARTDPGSPIYGMPILNADQAKNVIVIKRGPGRASAGIENALFFSTDPHAVRRRAGRGRPADSSGESGGLTARRIPRRSFDAMPAGFTTPRRNGSVV